MNESQVEHENKYIETTRILFDMGEVLAALGHGGPDGASALAPVGRTDLPVLVEVLERVQHADHLVHGPPDRHVVHRDVSDGAGAVDHEQSSKRPHQISMETVATRSPTDTPLRCAA